MAWRSSAHACAPFLSHDTCDYTRYSQISRGRNGAQVCADALQAIVAGMGVSRFLASQASSIQQRYVSSVTFLDWAGVWLTSQRFKARRSAVGCHFQHRRPLVSYRGPSRPFFFCCAVLLCRVCRAILLCRRAVPLCRGCRCVVGAVVSCGAVMSCVSVVPSCPFMPSGRFVLLCVLSCCAVASFNFVVPSCGCCRVSRAFLLYRPAVLLGRFELSRRAAFRAVVSCSAAVCVLSCSRVLRFFCAVLWCHHVVSCCRVLLTCRVCAAGHFCCAVLRCCCVCWAFLLCRCVVRAVAFCGCRRAFLHAVPSCRAVNVSCISAVPSCRFVCALSCVSVVSCCFAPSCPSALSGRVVLCCAVMISACCCSCTAARICAAVRNGRSCGHSF